MDRRRFLIGLGLCGALTVPLGCGSKEEAPEGEDIPAITPDEGEVPEEEESADEAAGDA